MSYEASLLLHLLLKKINYGIFKIRCIVRERHYRKELKIYKKKITIQMYLFSFPTAIFKRVENVSLLYYATTVMKLNDFDLNQKKSSSRHKLFRRNLTSQIDFYSTYTRFDYTKLYTATQTSKKRDNNNMSEMTQFSPTSSILT